MGWFLTCLFGCLAVDTAAVRFAEESSHDAAREGSLAKLGAVAPGIDHVKQAVGPSMFDAALNFGVQTGLVSPGLSEFVAVAKRLRSVYKQIKPEVGALFDQHTRLTALIPCKDDGTCDGHLQCSEESLCIEPNVTLEDTVEALMPKYKKLRQQRICAAPEEAENWIKLAAAESTGGTHDEALSKASEETSTCKTKRRTLVRSLSKLQDWMAEYKCFYNVGPHAVPDDKALCKAEALGSSTWHSLRMNLDESLQRLAVQEAMMCKVHTDCKPGEHCMNGRCTAGTCEGPACPKAVPCGGNAGDLDEWGCCSSTCGYFFRSCSPQEDFVFAGRHHHTFPGGDCWPGATRRLCCQKPEPRAGHVSVKSSCVPSSSEMKSGEINSAELVEYSEADEVWPSLEDGFNDLIKRDFDDQAREFHGKADGGDADKELDAESFYDMQARRIKAIDGMLESFAEACGGAVPMASLFNPDEKEQVVEKAAQEQDVYEDIMTAAQEQALKAAEAFRCLEGGRGFGRAGDAWATETVLGNVMPEMLRWAAFVCPSILRVAEEMFHDHAAGKTSTNTYTVGVGGLATRWQMECAEWEPLLQPGRLSWETVKDDSGEDGRTTLTLSSADGGTFDLAVDKSHHEFYTAIQLASSYFPEFGRFFLDLYRGDKVTATLKLAKLAKATDVYTMLRRSRWFNKAEIQQKCMAFAWEKFDEAHDYLASA